MSNIPGIPIVRGDLNSLFDKFGNLWIIYMSFDGITRAPFPFNIVVLLSTDGGNNFTVAFNTVGTPYEASGFLRYDYPQLAFGGDGNGAYALWWTVDFENVVTFDTFNTRLGYIPISATGIPDLTAIRQVDLPAIGINSQFGIFISSLTVSDEGQVYFWGNSITSAVFKPPFANSIMYVNPKGINFTANDIHGPFIVAQSNTAGAFFGSPQVPFQNVRGIIQPGARTLAFDNNRGLLYALVNDFFPWNSSNMTVYLVYSENGGQSWSEGIPISDDNVGNRSIVGMDLDSDTGNISFCWYDARGDPTNNTVRFFGAILLGCEIDRIRGSNAKCLTPIFRKVDSNIQLLPKIKLSEANIKKLHKKMEEKKL